MSKARKVLQETLAEYYKNYNFIFNSYYATATAEDVLKTKVSNYHGKKTTVISKIAREENFTAEEVAAFRAGIEKFDAETVITAIKNQDYNFYPDAYDFEDLGEILRDRLIDDGILPNWFLTFVDCAKLGDHHILNANEYVFSDYGYFELF